MSFMWGCYSDLDLSRTSSGFGPNPLSYAEIEAYGRLIGIDWRPWQVRALKMLDAAFLQFCAKRQQ